MKQLEALFSLPSDATDAWRTKMWQRCHALGLPPLKSEGFEYVPLAKWYARSYLSTQKELQPVEKHVLAECASRYLVFIDGSFHPELSSIPSLIVALPLSKAMKSYGLFLQHRLQKILKEETDFFAFLNGACHGEGLFLYVPPSIQQKEPLQILHFSSEKTLAFPRIQCVMGKGASLSLIQTSPQYDTQGVIDCVLDEAARLTFYDMSIPSVSAWQMQAFRALVKRDAHLQAFFATTGAETVRTSFAIELAEENSEALVNGLSLLRGKSESHLHGRIEHKAPHCRSRQQVKSVLFDEARCSFEGKIFVQPVAQKTEAYQTSQSLLLSPSATTFAKPNLEIFADDVKASHGATVSRPDAEALFYLRSRGLSLVEAQTSLIQGFCQEFLQQIPFVSLQNQLMQTLFSLGAPHA